MIKCDFKQGLDNPIKVIETKRKWGEQIIHYYTHNFKKYDVICAGEIPHKIAKEKFEFFGKKH